MKRTSMLFCLFLSIVASLLTPAKAQVNVNDSLALVDLYNSTNGPHWTRNTNWLTTAPVSTWADVYVTDNRVTSLDLYGNNMRGTIPASIGNINHLVTLSLQNNNLTGNIPASIGNLDSLVTLSLQSNNLTGNIPASIGNCTKLTYLYLSFNNLSSSIPPAIGNLVNLYTLQLNNNQLSNAIPASIGSCKNLTYLWLSDNQLSGAIPAEISNCTNLFDLELRNNQLSGAIPASIGNLQNLFVLVLSYNQLSGAIPAGIGKLVRLDALRLEFNQLSGAIPKELGELGSMSTLFLNHNQLNGTVPTSFGKLKGLLEIELGYNQLTEDQNYNPSIKTRYIFGTVNNNLFTFNRLEFVAEKFPEIAYAPQITILPIHQNGNTLSAYAGGTLSNNTYNWHLAGTTDSTIIKADSTFTPSQSGQYYVSVTNAVATKLTLYSDTIDFTLSPLKQNSSTFITKTVQSTTIKKHMQVYPNPAKEVIHVQVNGTAMIAISNADGKVLLTKSITNSDAINVSSLAPGIYYLRNKTSGEVQKVVVIH